MKQLFLSALTVAFTAAGGVLLRGFVYGSQQGDPEYYILLGAGLFLGVGILSLNSLAALVASK
jgi:hypothetical protein